MSDRAVSGKSTMVFRGTHLHSGRKISVSPENSTMKHLSYGRIVLGPETPSIRFGCGGRETGLICLRGEAEVKTGETRVRLVPYDSMYIPRDSEIEISTGSSADVAEFSAPVTGNYPLQIVRNEEIARDPGLKFTTGGPGCTRQLQMLLAKNIQAGRLVAGITHSEPGNWTSWPPHEHAKLLEEMYVFVDMPAPAFGIQFVYNDTQEPELMAIVREGDAVMIPSGYHPNVSVPGHRIGFLWAMAAHREVEDRLFGVVNVQPGFDQGKTGLEAGRMK